MRSKFLVLLCLPLASVAAANDFRFEYTTADLVAPDALYARLDKAVAEHCRNVNDMRSLRVVQACEKSLMTMAVQEIDHPQLTAYIESSQSRRS